MRCKDLQSDVFFRPKKYLSEQSILVDHNTLTPGQNKGLAVISVGSALETSRYRLSSHRSDHEIHTPEHRSFVKNENVSKVLF